MIIKRFELLVALRYLLTKRKEGFLSIINAFALIGIALGVATLIIVMSVMNGYETELIDKIVNIRGHIGIYAKNGDLYDYNAILAKIKKEENFLKQDVKFLAPVVEGQAMILKGSKIAGVIVRGMNFSDLHDKPLLSTSLLYGSFEQSIEHGFEDSIIIGINLADQLNVSVGDSLKLAAPQTNATAVGPLPRMKTFRITGIFDLGMYEYNSTLVFISLKAAQIFFKQYEAIDHIEIILNNFQRTNAAKSLLISKFSNYLKIIDWTALNQTLVQALSIERTVMFLILSLIILIAAFNIISSLMILVKDKSKSIAILRTIGATKASIVRIFILCGFAIGLCGTICGTILGVVFTVNIERIRMFLEKLLGIPLFDPVIYFLTRLPAELKLEEIVYITTIALVLSFIATIYPAIRIARLAPVEILRRE